MTAVFTLFNGPFHDASLFHASCVPSGGRHQLQSSSRLLLHSSSLDWTIVTAFCSNFLPTSSNTSSLFRTLLHQSIIGYSRAHQPSLAEHLFKLAVLTYRSIHSTSPSYLQSCFTRVADMTSRRRLRSSASYRLEVPPVLLSTVGKRAFCSCRRHLTSAQSLAVFR